MADVWEYKVVEQRWSDPTAREKSLNDLGKEGWELVTTDQFMGQTWLHLKRKVG